MGCCFERPEANFDKKVLIYPNFAQDYFGTRNDLALVLLEQAVPKPYQAIKFQMHGQLQPGLGEITYVGGFGRSSDSQNTPSDDYRLRLAQFPIARWERSTIFDSEKIWIAQNKTKSISGGDSGSPLLLIRNGEYWVYGIAIHRRYDDCVKLGTCQNQAAFSNLTFFQSWIQNSINELSNLR